MQNEINKKDLKKSITVLSLDKGIIKKQGNQ